MTGRGLIIASPRSGSGKTTITLGICRALSQKGIAVAAAKSGPDYIDSAYLSAATRQPARTLDALAMRPHRLHQQAAVNDLLIVEGAMGYFDGSDSGRGSVADLATQLDLPVVLIVDTSSTAQSILPVIAGFAAAAKGRIKGVILNRIGSDRHLTLISEALHALPLPILGHVRRAAQIQRPSRHLGLVQAREDANLDSFLDQTADHVIAHLDLQALIALAAPLPTPAKPPPVPQLGSRIAIADDAAFAFTYPHILDDWRTAGAVILPFSPLADQPPAPEADAIYLPGGYPELHALTLARAGTFRSAMQSAAQRGTAIYGECGGYMTLGHTITDAKGIAYPMCGLLNLRTSFEKRRLHLGYRTVTATTGPLQGQFTAHEFHYATIISETGPPLFTAQTTIGTPAADMGLIKGSVAGSFAHIIDRTSD